MEPVEPVRGNASQHKVCRKRVVTKNELKRILTYYTSQLPCVTEACKVEKRELNSLVKTLQEEVRAKDASIKVLRENLATMRFTIREFSCFIASKHPGTTIAAAAQTWEKRWKAEDEDGLWNTADSPKVQSAVRRYRSHTKPSTSSVANTSTANNMQPEKAQFTSPQQNNMFHEFARKNAVAISRLTNPNITRKSSANSEQFISASLSTATNSGNCPTPQTQSVATAHALITVNQPLNLPMPSDVSSHILMPTSSQYKTIQANNSSQLNGQSAVNHTPAAGYLRLNSAETKRKNRNGPIGIRKFQRSETVSDVIILSDDESDEKVDIISEDMVTVPRYDSTNSLVCKKSHPLVYPRLRIYPGLRISRLHITWLNSFEDITKTKHIILNVRYAGEYSKQIFHILYYIRSMVEKEEAEGWTRIYSKECEAGGNSRLRIQFDEGQTWLNDAVYFTGFIECGFERYGAYADVCKVELGLQDKQMPANFTRRYWP
ncbi:hypothetical protein LOAG_07971 [Loa loa]|uniref:Uncharacterized protein n=1 Tax=Loa loa TaxID=7209 RepID=A0A1S0TW89_LOALO|nr:hypothetical protein LOAG_07971 [Loa loa]EFO20519.2 hypothetical protein LOAG_07971 [Loa loa]